MWRYIKTTRVLSRTNNTDNVIAFKYRSILRSWNLALRLVLFIVLIRRVAIFIDHIIIRRRVWPRKRDRFQRKREIVWNFSGVPTLLVFSSLIRPLKSSAKFEDIFGRNWAESTSPGFRRLLILSYF